MKISIKNQDTGELCPITRDVSTTHPQWVHRQLGTASEEELQAVLDSHNVGMWYLDGKHLGPDGDGLIMETEPNDARRILERRDDGHVTDFGDHLVLTVAEDYDIEDLQRELPPGAVADWTGSGNTDADGETTEDIRITITETIA
jgi:hypothetical protein